MFTAEVAVRGGVTLSKCVLVRYTIMAAETALSRRLIAIFIKARNTGVVVKYRKVVMLLQLPQTPSYPV